MSDEKNQTSLMEFPVDIQVKAMGLNEPDFKDHVREIVRRHTGDDVAMSVVVRPSRGDKYLSVSCHFRAQSRGQLDSIYMDLSRDARVMVAL